MRLITAVLVIGFTFFAPSSHAIVLERMLEAAQEVGYQVASEFEFGIGSTTPVDDQVDATLRRVGALCPMAFRPSTVHSSETRLILIAWSDHEYPRVHRASSIHGAKLAELRARTVQNALSSRLQGHVHFDQVNMATRHPHDIALTVHATRTGESANLKSVLEEEGAAPTDPYQIGLFGEYAQRSKVLVWVDCTQPRKPQIHSETGVKLAERN